MKFHIIEKIILLISQFLEGDVVSLSENERMEPNIFHYYHEVIRYFNKLNFVISKTLRSLRLNINLQKYDKAFLLYVVYRKMEEKKSDHILEKEYDNIDKFDFLNLPKSQYLQFLNRLESFSWDIALKGKDKVEQLSIKEAYPSFLIKKLLDVMDFEFLKNNLRSMNEAATHHTFRINFSGFEGGEDVLLSNILNYLNQENIKFSQDEDFNFLFHIKRNYYKKILRSKFCKEGQLIPQGKASVSVVEVLSPEKNDFILDICAAPGMKTSLMAQDLENKKRNLVGNEFLPSRAFEMKELMHHLGYTNVALLNSDGISPPIRKSVKFDKILLDAPCTGSGTLRKNPDLKWRQNRAFLYQNVTLQRKLLQSSLDLLKPKGILVYSTCSLYPEENEMIIKDFKNLLEPMILPDWFSPSYSIDGERFPGTGRLFPSTHHTEGFFIGKFKKKAI